MLVEPALDISCAEGIIDASTILHRIILGLSMASLEEVICRQPKDANSTYLMGPIKWPEQPAGGIIEHM